MKKPLSLLLLEAQNELVRLNASNAELAKKLESAEQRSKYTSDNCSEALSVVEDLHSMLDMLPTAPARERVDPDSSYGAKTKLSPAARLVGYVASRAA